MCMYVYTYIYIYMCVCERDGERHAGRHTGPYTRHSHPHKSDSNQFDKFKLQWTGSMLCVFNQFYI